ASPTEYHPRIVAEYAVNRLDHLADGLCRSQEKPLITEQALESWLGRMGLKSENRQKTKIYESINAYKDALAASSDPQQRCRQWESALNAIKEELRADQPRTVVIQ